MATLYTSKNYTHSHICIALRNQKNKLGVCFNKQNLIF